MKIDTSLKTVNVETTCRICLNNDAVKDIYGKKKSIKTLNVSCDVMISSLFSLSTHQDDGLPYKLCRKCYTKLVSAYKLKLLANESYTRLLQHLSKDASQTYYHKHQIDNEDEKFLNNKDDVKREEEIKTEIEDVMLVSTIIKDECVAQVLGISECKEDGGDVISDYDAEDDTPLVYYSLEDQGNRQIVTQDDDSEIVKRKPRQRKKIKIEKPKKEKRKKKHGPLSGVCDLCGKFVMNIAAHKVIHSENRKKYPCGDCPKVFSSSGARSKHRNANHLGKMYFCELCNKSYKRGWDHNRLKHSNRPLIYACVLCDKRFAEKSLLTFHITSHTKERPFSCDVCGNTFRTRMSCIFHKRRVHDKEKRHGCNLCPRAFFSLHHLRIHMRSHTKEKIYKCPECGKGFSTSSGLSIHKKRHLGIKTFTCHICSNSFVCGGSLKTHMISHTKERTHPCRYCGVMFGRTDHRNRHERTAHKNKAAAVQ